MSTGFRYTLQAAGSGLYSTRLIGGLLLLLLPAVLWGQAPPAEAPPLQHCRGSAKIRVEEHWSRKAAERYALDLARKNALESRFGNDIRLTTFTELHSSQTDQHPAREHRELRMEARSTTQAQWVTTEKETTQWHLQERDNASPEVWVEADIAGKCRAVGGNPAKLAVQLGPCIGEACEQNVFRSGDDFHLQVLSNQPGWLAIFLEGPDEVQRLFPYPSLPAYQYSKIEIPINQAIALFSARLASEAFHLSPSTVDEYSFVLEEPASIAYRVHIFFLPSAPGEPTPTQLYPAGSGFSYSKATFEQWVEATHLHYPRLQSYFREILLTP